MLLRALLGCVVGCVLLACAGGGALGDLGFDSTVVIDLEGVNGSTPSQLYLSISPNNGSHNATNAASTTQSQPWVQRTITNQRQRFEFQTASREVPYQVWVGTRVAFDRDCRIIITIDGIQRYNRVGTALSGAPQRVIQIERNHIAE